MHAAASPRSTVRDVVSANSEQGIRQMILRPIDLNEG